MINRRTTTRQPMHLPVRFDGDDEAQEHGMLRDLSSCGAFVLTDDWPPAEGTTLTVCILRIGSSGVLVRAVARVVRRDATGMGLHFIAMDARCHAVLHTLCSTRQPRMRRDKRGFPLAVAELAAS